MTAPERRYDLCFYYEPFYTTFLASNYAHANRCKPRSDHSLRKGLINAHIFFADMMSYVKARPWIVNSVNNDQNAPDGIVWSE